MANNKTDYLENHVLNLYLRNNGGAGAFTPPATVYVGLFTAAPGEAAGGTEVTGGSYARTAVTFGAASGGQVANSADVNFPQATANWGTISDFAIFDASSGGNMLYYGPLAASKVVNNGDTFKIPSGSLTVQEL